MKHALTICLGLLFATLTKAQDFSQLSFSNIDGQTITMSNFNGKKVLFFILPLSQSDSNYTQLQAFKARYKDTVQIVGVPSFEDGYQASGSAALKALYSNMGILITEGMYTRRASAGQSELMKWLTNKSKNQHFDMDASGIGHKFFVSGTGREFAVMPGQVPLTAPLIDRIVRSPN